MSERLLVDYGGCRERIRGTDDEDLTVDVDVAVAVATNPKTPYRYADQSSGLRSTKVSTISPSMPSTSTRPRFSGEGSLE